MKVMIKIFTIFLLVTIIAVFSAVGQITNPLNKNTVINDDYTYSSETSLQTNQNGTVLTINSPYTLTINTDIEVTNNGFQIIVNEGATFIVNGDINFVGFNGNGNNRPTLDIEGVAVIYGGVSGNGVIDTGDNGSIYIQDNPEEWESVANVLPVDPFPIELLSFKVSKKSDKIMVEWSTAAEINNDFFNVERSIDGNSWETLTYINGAGNANYVINYSYTDKNPIEGVSYYRLKQTDYDGQYEYFAPAEVNFSSFVSNTKIIKVLPSAQNMEVWFHNQDPNAVMTVADMQGRILYSSKAHVADFVQQISVNLPRNYSGEVVMFNLRTNDKTDGVKLIVR